MANIWDSLSTFRDHPIFFQALTIVKGKIEYGSLSGQYDIADSEGSNHKDVLLRLPGTIRVVNMDDQDAYAYTDSQGIAFNRSLVVASSQYCATFDSAAAALETLDGLSYSAVFQETMEHELAHLKNHHELMHDPDLRRITQPDSPLYKESGYAVQRKIRDHAGQGAEPRILEVSIECKARRWAPPLSLEYGMLAVEDGEMAAYETDHPVLSFDQIKQHMNYSTFRTPGQQSPEPARRGREEPSNDHDDDDDDTAARPAKRQALGGGGDVRPSSTRPRGSPVTLSAAARAGGVSSFGLPGGQENQPANAADHAFSSNKANKDEDGEEELAQLFLSLKKNRVLREVLKTQSNTSVDVQFCDKNGNERASFTTSQDIYVNLTFTNTSDEDAYVQIYRGRFGRQGVGMSIKDQENKYLPTDGRSCYVVAKIAPGQSHTFFRKFCGGPNGRNTNTGGVTLGEGSDVNLVTCWTPERPGTYTATVNKWDGEFTFRIHTQE